MVRWLLCFNRPLLHNALGQGPPPVKLRELMPRSHRRRLRLQSRVSQDVDAFRSVQERERTLLLKIPLFNLELRAFGELCGRIR